MCGRIVSVCSGCVGCCAFCLICEVVSVSPSILGGVAMGSVLSI